MAWAWGSMRADDPATFVFLAAFTVASTVVLGVAARTHVAAAGPVALSLVYVVMSLEEISSGPIDNDPAVLVVATLLFAGLVALALAFCVSLGVSLAGSREGPESERRSPRH